MANPEWLTAHPIAHRGYHDMNRSVFENTIPAFERAVEAGFTIECDLQYAADGVPVVFHDHDLKRLCAVEGKLRERLSSDLQQMAVGGSKERIPSVGQLLKTVGGQVPLVIELKSCEGDDEGFAGAVLDALESYDGPMALMSFDVGLLEALKALGAPMPVGLTAEGTAPERLEQNRQAMEFGLDFISYNWEHLPNPFIDELRENGTPIITWTVRGEDGVRATRLYGDQMTFEGFDPREVSA